MAITVKCGSCEKRFRAKDELAGKKVKCPGCGGILKIPAPVPAEDASSDYKLADDEYKLAGQTAPKPAPKPAAPAQAPARPASPPVGGAPAGRAPARGAPPGGAPAPAAQQGCPSCAQPLPPNAVLCVACGLDLRSGRRLETSVQAATVDEEEAETETTLTKAAKGAGSFMLGCVLSLVGALIGAVVWYLVAMLTEREYAIIAWGLGVLAGLGMLIGSRRDNEMGGITAAFISIVGIIAAKWLIFAKVLLPLLRMAEEVAAEAMPSTTKLFFTTMFDPLDGVFILLAFFTAYMFGTGRGSD